MNIHEIYVEKKQDFAVEAASVASDLRFALGIQSIEKVRIINRYFAEGINSEDFEKAKNTIFSEPATDIVYLKLPDIKAKMLFIEYLPGQFDQRASSCSQCIAILTGKEKPVIQCAKIFAFYGNITDNDLERIKSYLINPVECREACTEKPVTLLQKFNEPEKIKSIEGFNSLSTPEFEELRAKLNLAMDIQDLQFCQNYFRDEEKREPTITELRVLDTYWSDHCRHTTFLTELDEIKIDDDVIRESFNNYLELRVTLGRSGKPTLMDIATIGARALKKRGLLSNLDESDEINACSVKIKVDVEKDGITQEEDWLLMFKNETHNHPTEIEPFGGAATCLGGAIRDPLSGRAYVYQAMRVTGAANPLEDSASTIPGKLPMRKICKVAAAGYSSYGNQIGAAAGHVHEIYHPGYKAKRMELGAVIGAAPKENVVRITPDKSDVVILLGGRTGRDGIGGATSSSKSHDQSSHETCSAEVQKGNPVEERKILRLFRDRKAATLIKKCNDFGAGGVSVSVGELADGLVIDLDKVPKKYEGLDGTEIAISESQERMSVVVAKKDADSFIKLASDENLEATVIAKVTDEKRLVMNWKGNTIVNLSRKFLDSNGEKKHAKVHITTPAIPQTDNKTFNKDTLLEFAASLNICSQKGLIDGFDSSAGCLTVISPLGGKHQLTPAQVMAAKIPVLEGNTKTCSLMSWGFDPVISSISPYHGAVFAVVHSLAKIIAAGGKRESAYLSFQEYFERLKDEPLRWGKPCAALLGALDAQIGLEIAAIGGKDSMSGSFSTQDTEINVPPTLVSFAVSTAKTDNIVTPEFKKSGSYVYHFKPPCSVFEKCDFTLLREYFDSIEKLIAEKKALSVWALGSGGTAEAIIKMCVGNRLGFEADILLDAQPGFGGFIIETNSPLPSPQSPVPSPYSPTLLGRTATEYTLKTKIYELPFEKIQSAWEDTLEPVYPYQVKQEGKPVAVLYDKGVKIKASQIFAKPKFLIPVFPGTNGEYETARAVEKAGGAPEIFVIRNLAPADIAESISGLEKAIRTAQALVIPGGSSAGDEPDGAGIMISAFFRNSAITDSVMELLQKREGLICGIGNGFQALIKLGLVPYGEIRDMTETSPTLACNTIGRHQATFVRTKIVSNSSPWLSHLELGGTYIVPVSHAKGRFVAEESVIKELAANGQIATQYVDFDGNPSQDIRFNPNNSCFAVEGLTSPDGRIFGRMAHNERIDDGLFQNIPGISKMDIFTGAVRYFN